MTPTVLHVSAQRPGLTGSGVALDALARCAAGAGWAQAAVIGIPAEEHDPSVGPLPAERIRPLRFGTRELPFPVPGMSDVMPYRSTRFSDLDEEAVAAYRGAWRRHLAAAIDAVAPDLVHAHHVWIVGALLKEVAPGMPVVIHSHATGLRQMALCPHLAPDVREGCRRNERFCALHAEHAEELARVLGIDRRRVDVVGSGYRHDVFHARGLSADRWAERIVYIGKSSTAKGVPWLLDAVERLAAVRPGLELHMAGSGAGPEADAIHHRVADLAGTVVHHGQLAQAELADLMRSCRVAVLPSFYEGVPLVLAEALACGCRLVATRLPGIATALAPALGPYLDLVPAPRLAAVDRPLPADLPVFVDALTDALDRALDAPPPDVASPAFAAALAPFTWTRIFGRVERIWRELLDGV